MTQSFTVSDVPVGKLSASGQVTTGEAIHRLTSPARARRTNKGKLEVERPAYRGVEACSHPGAKIIACDEHPLIACMARAFADHIPLRLSPDHIWQVLVQGFAAHVHLHHEDLRDRLGAPPGRPTLTVRRDDFVRGKPDNPWPEVFAAFAEKIEAEVGPRQALIAAEYSTTGPVERAVGQLSWMDVMERYFEYEFLTLCGIPQITLLGEVDDWQQLRTRAQHFAEYDLEWWLKQLDPVLLAFVDAAAGHADPAFWRSMFNLDDASGGPYASGWVNVLYPYICQGEQRTLVINEFAREWQREGYSAGPTPGSFPSGLRRVPFTWNYFGDLLEMEFLGGFVGIHHDAAAGTIEPRLGWAVAQAE